MKNGLKTTYSQHEEYLKALLDIYSEIKPKINSRLSEFKQLWDEGSELDLYCELVFCLFTPQSKAKVCNEAVLLLQDKNLLLDGSEVQLGDELNIVRFRYTKAKNLVESRKLFVKNGKVRIKPKIQQFKNSYEIREWLVENVRGIGYKEASHFLRNVGQGSNLAILDRHILKNLVLLGVISEMPKTMSRKNYLEIEKKLLEFSNKISIPPDHLDLLLWYKETGEIFK